MEISFTPMRYTLRQVLNFMWHNRGKRCFKDFTYAQAAAIVIAAASHDGLLVVEDDIGICGAAIIRIQDGFLMVDFLVARRNGFLTFLDLYKRKYSKYPILATRDGKKTIYCERELCRPLRVNSQAADLQQVLT